MILVDKSKKNIDHLKKLGREPIKELRDHGVL